MTLDPTKRRLIWEPLESEELTRCALFSIHRQRSRSPRNDKIYEFQVISSSEWVAVVPLTPDGKVVMVRQYRHGSKTLSLEPPGGLVKEGQHPLESGREELEEETGYIADEYILLGVLDPMPALFTNKFHIYLAKNAVPAGAINPDETEDLETILLTPTEVREFIRSGEITSAVMIAALHLFLDYLDRNA